MNIAEFPAFSQLFQRVLGVGSPTSGFNFTRKNGKIAKIYVIFRKFLRVSEKKNCLRCHFTAIISIMYN